MAKEKTWEEYYGRWYQWDDGHVKSYCMPLETLQLIVKREGKRNWTVNIGVADSTELFNNGQFKSLKEAQQCAIKWAVRLLKEDRSHLESLIKIGK